MADCAQNVKFPSESLVPKNETGVLNFLKKYPKFNGEGVTIAIFDSGVDPKASGLEVNLFYYVTIIDSPGEVIVIVICTTNSLI